MNEHIKNLQGLILALEARRVKALDKIPNAVEIEAINTSIRLAEKLIRNVDFVDDVRGGSDEMEL